MDQPLIDLAERAWRLHKQFQGREFLVTPSAPVLYFGDLKSYLASPIKVITVGLNPSQAEFPPRDPFQRFSGADRDGPNQYLSALDGYFRSTPYTAWFNPAFESLLNGIQASYYDRETSTALHTDLCSPLATNPTWSKLGRKVHAELQNEGVGLWHDLVRYLRPDLVLISVARKYLRLIEFAMSEPFRTIFTVKRKNPYDVEAARFAVDHACRPLVVFGKAAQLPFGTISAETKRGIGMLIHGNCFNEG